jgi:hypothetical protein
MRWKISACRHCRPITTCKSNEGPGVALSLIAVLGVALLFVRHRVSRRMNHIAFRSMYLWAVFLLCSQGVRRFAKPCPTPYIALILHEGRQTTCLTD